MSDLPVAVERDTLLSINWVS